MADRFSRFNEERDFQVKKATGTARIQTLLGHCVFWRVVLCTVWCYLFKPLSSRCNCDTRTAISSQFSIDELETSVSVSLSSLPNTFLRISKKISKWPLTFETCRYLTPCG